MPEIVPCPSCGRRLRLREEYLDRRLQCPACQTLFLPAEVVPAAPPPPAPPPEPTPEANADADSPEPAPEEPAAEPPRRSRVRPRRRARVPVKKRGNTAAAVAVIGGVFGLIVLYFLILLWQFGPPARERGAPPPPFAQAGDNPEARRRLVRDAFLKQPPLTVAEIKEELPPFFEKLCRALRTGDPAQGAAHVHADRFFDVLIEDELLPVALRERRGEIARFAGEDLCLAVLPTNGNAGWLDFEIQQIQKLPANEAVVTARHHMGRGHFLHLRWWLTREGGFWQAFDVEDRDLGRRHSVWIGGAYEVELRHPQAQMHHKLNEALRAGWVRNPQAAEKHLQEVAGVRFPKAIEGQRLLAVGLVGLNRGQYEDAFRAFDEADRANPAILVLDQFRGQAYNRLGRGDAALRHLNLYRAALGEDALTSRELGYALAHQMRFPEAAAAYRKALDFDSKDGEAFLGLVQALGPGVQHDDLKDRLARLDEPREQFDRCAKVCRQSRHAAGLEPLCLAMRRLDPDYAPTDFFLAQSKTWTGRQAEAVPLFRAALAKQKDPARRSDYLAEFARALAGAGQVRDAYAALGIPREAFRLLAPELRKGFRIDDLGRLVAVHAQKDPGDPALPFYRGEVYVQQGKYKLADQAFAEALAKPADDINPDDFRASRVLARYHTGQALSAYADIGPRHETFSQLTNLCFADENYPLLEAVLDAHEKHFPGNAEVLRQRGRLALRRDQFAEAARLFRAALAKQTQPEGRKRLVDEFLFDAVDAGKALEGYRAAPDAAEAFRILANDLLTSGRRAELKALLASHRQGHAGDAWTAFYEGECHLDEQAWDKAARSLGEAWRSGPDDLRRRARSRYAFALYRAGRGVAAYQEAGAGKETFSQLAHLMAQEKKGAELEALVAAHRPSAGDGPEVPFVDARAKVFLGRPAEAVPLLEEARRKQIAAPQRRYYVTQFVTDMELMGRGLEGYRAAPDKTAAFESLGHTLTHQKLADRLEELLKEHRKEHAADPWLAHFTGELWLLRGDAKRAAGHFAAALAKAPPQNNWAFRRGLLRARVKAGEAVRAYREMGQGRNPFLDVAQLCLAEKNVGQLEALIAEHRRSEPDANVVVDWELEALWLKGDYAGALALIDRHREDVFSLLNHRWKGDNYRVRALVKLKRHDEAVRAAEEVTKSRQGNRVLLVLAHAVRGDVRQAMAALGKQSPRSYLIGDCYRDPDLGPILRGEPFRAFRERFPEPKGNERFDDDDLD